MLGDAVGFSKEHRAPFNVKCQVVWIESFNPEVLARSLLRYGKRADGVAFMALEHPAVREAVQVLADRGVATVTVVSDLSGSRRDACVGLDNRAAGRTAAYLIGRFIAPRGGQGGDDRRQPELRRARGARGWLSADHRGAVSRDPGRWSARRPG